MNQLGSIALCINVDITFFKYHQNYYYFFKSSFIAGNLNGNDMVQCTCISTCTPNYNTMCTCDCVYYLDEAAVIRTFLLEEVHDIVESGCTVLCASI